MAIVKVNWSGGKDSSCALKLHLDCGDYVKAVCYIPMLNDKIPLLLKEHYEFILNTADKFRSLGADVFIVHGLSYYDFVHKRITRGVNKGKVFGFPPFLKGMCTFKNYSKLPALNNIDLGYFDYEDIGIAADEYDRLGQLTDRKRSILLEHNFKENDALKFCYVNDILSPHYNLFSRDGCVICPHAKPSVRVRWYSQYPEAFNIILDLQEFVKLERPEQRPLSHKKWFIDDSNVQLDFLEVNKKYNLF